METHGTTSRIRTDTARGLSPLPLPLGYRGTGTRGWIRTSTVRHLGAAPPADWATRACYLKVTLASVRLPRRDIWRMGKELHLRDLSVGFALAGRPVTTPAPIQIDSGRRHALCNARGTTRLPTPVDCEAPSSLLCWQGLHGLRLDRPVRNPPQRPRTKGCESNLVLACRTARRRVGQVRRCLQPLSRRETHTERPSAWSLSIPARQMPVRGVPGSQGSKRLALPWPISRCASSEPMKWRKAEGTIPIPCGTTCFRDRVPTIRQSPSVVPPGGFEPPTSAF